MFIEYSLYFGFKRAFIFANGALFVDWQVTVVYRLSPYVTC